MEQKPWVIGVLSTDYDLQEYRKEVCDRLKTEGYTVSAFELPEYPVTPFTHSHDACLDALGRVDIALVIINKRCGSMYCGEDDNGKKVTITEAEYLRMVKSEKPTFAFVHEKAFDELHRYKVGFKAYKDETPNVDEEELKKTYDKKYECTYVEKVETLHFVQMIQDAHGLYGSSNWMKYFKDIDSLINAIDGVLKGYTKSLLQKLSELQKENVLNKHSSTSIGMSLRDVFSSHYYIEAPYTVESGKALIPSEELSLSESIDSVLRKKQSVLIYGEAGYGKTTVIAKCFVDRVIRGSTEYEIPLYISLRNKGNQYSFSQKEYLCEEFAETMHKLPYPHLDLSSITFYFYCDGFDELTESLSEEDIDRIRETEIFKCCMVLTCRQQFVTRYLKVHAFSDVFAVRIRMKSWNSDTICKYISNYYSKKGIETTECERLIEAVNTDKELQHLINSPLLVTMLLSYVDRKGIDSGISDITSVELFSDWMDELANLEHSKKAMASKEIVEVWKNTAWQLYLCRRDNTTLADEDLAVELKKKSEGMNTDLALSTLDSVFDRKGHEICGAFHEQFMEYLAAALLVDSCLTQKEPYPDFLIYVLRPEINRYFRGIWNTLSNSKKSIVFESIRKQYTDNIGKDASEAIATRVHAAYHMCRLEYNQRDEVITQAFNSEKHISVLLSLFFGAIKLGHLDKEECFYSLLTKDPDFSKANRGYHMVYYADMIPKGSFPYLDDNESTWVGTMNAIRNHFSNKKPSYFYMQRVDLFTLRELITSREKVYPLTEEVLEEIDKSITECPFNNSTKNKIFIKKIRHEYVLLKQEYEKYCCE